MTTKAHALLSRNTLRMKLISLANMNENQHFHRSSVSQKCPEYELSLRKSKAAGGGSRKRISPFSIDAEKNRGLDVPGK